MDLREAGAAGPERHPWELARAACILGLLPPGGLGRVGDIGAGDLYFARELLKRGPSRLAAVDPGYPRAEERDGIALYPSLGQLADGSLELAFLMDVLEHEPDDRRLLEEALRTLAPGGRLVVTVPAFGFLFSAHDAFLGHLRRYRRRTLQGLLRGLDAEPAELFHFFTTLFLVRGLQRLLAALGLPFPRPGLGRWGRPERHPLTRALVGLLTADFACGRWLARHRIHLPGLSLCLILRKPSAW